MKSHVGDSTRTMTFFVFLCCSRLGIPKIHGTQHPTLILYTHWRRASSDIFPSPTLSHLCASRLRTCVKMVYIRQRQLPKLHEYKYAGVDHSLLSKYVLKPFYTQVIKLFPMSMAPNAITLSGFSFVIINLITLIYYNPGLDQDCPPWVYLSWSIGLFLYQTFDAVDGSQARRTKQSGPLGELFDHGMFHEFASFARLTWNRSRCVQYKS